MKPNQNKPYWFEPRHNGHIIVTVFCLTPDFALDFALKIAELMHSAFQLYCCILYHVHINYDECNKVYNLVVYEVYMEQGGYLVHITGETFRGFKRWLLLKQEEGLYSEDQCTIVFEKHDMKVAKIFPKNLSTRGISLFDFILNLKSGHYLDILASLPIWWTEFVNLSIMRMRKYSILCQPVMTSDGYKIALDAIQKEQITIANVTESSLQLRKAKNILDNGLTLLYNSIARDKLNNTSEETMDAFAHLVAFGIKENLINQIVSTAKIEADEAEKVATAAVQAARIKK